MSKIKKQFIAGAVCPACKQVDKIRAWKEGDVNKQECVSCGFADELRFPQTAREVDTRVNQLEEKVRAETQVLHFPEK